MPLLHRSKALVAEGRLARALNADERLAGAGVTGVAAVGQIVEGGDKLVIVLRSGRLFKPFYPGVNDGLDHVGDSNPVDGRMKPGRVLQAFLDLVDLIGRELPVAALAGKPKFGVANLGRHQELAEARFVR